MDFAAYARRQAAIRKPDPVVKYQCPACGEHEAVRDGEYEFHCEGCGWTL